MVACIRGIGAIAGAGLTIMVLGGPALAASFDCAIANTPDEQLICSDPILSKLDEALAAVYDAALADVPPADAPVLRDSQRAWLKQLRAACLWGTADAVACRRSAYGDRIVELARGVQVRGPYVFMTIRRDYWSADLADCESDEPIQRRVSYPQFVAPLSAAQAAWNRDTAATVEREVKDWLEGDLGCNPQFFYDVAVDGAMEGFLSISSGATWMGNAHLWDSISREQRLLATGKSLQAEDLFDPAKPWREKLSELAAVQLEADAESPIKPTDIVDQAASTGNWEVSADHLTVSIDFYRMPNGRSGHGTAEILWRDLKPYLRTNLPIPLKLD